MVGPFRLGRTDDGRELVSGRCMSGMCNDRHQAPDPGLQVDVAAKVMVVVDLATRAMWGGSAWNFDPETLTASRA